MTTARIHKLITSLQHRKRMSQTIDDLESKIGALWKKSDKHGKDYLAGQLDLGVLGKVQIAVFQNRDKQNEQSPDATIHLFEGD